MSFSYAVSGVCLSNTEYVAYLIIYINEGSNEKKNKYFYITIYNVNTCSHRLPASETRNHITR